MTRSTFRSSTKGASSSLVFMLALACCGGERAGVSVPAEVAIPQTPATPTGPTAQSASALPLFEAWGQSISKTTPASTLVWSNGWLAEYTGERLCERARGDEWAAWTEPGSNWEERGLGQGPRGDIFRLSTLNTEYGDNDGPGRVSRLVSRVWVEEVSLPHLVPMDLAAWSEGRMLLLARTSAWQPRLLAIGTPNGLPELTPASFNHEASAVGPLQMAALPTGEVYIVGWLRESKDLWLYKDGAKGAWERFAAGSTRGVLETLVWEDKNPVPKYIRTRSRADVWIAGVTAGGGGFVGRWDGTSWSFRAVDQPVDSFDVEPDGTLWVVARKDHCAPCPPGRLLHGAYDKPLESVSLPDLRDRDGSMVSVAPMGVWATGPGDVWVAVEGAGKRFWRLLRTLPTPPLEPLALSEEETRFRAENPFENQSFEKYSDNPTMAPVPYTKSCPAPFVTILELPKGAPADFDYPVIARALKGKRDLSEVRFIEYAGWTNRRLGARVPDAATGRRVAALLRGVAGPAPKLVCFRPFATRRLEFDFQAGVLARSGPP